MKAERIDTNILLRYLTADVPKQALQCRDLFQQVLDGKVSLEIPLLILTETLWTLVKFYKQSKKEAVESLVIIVKTPGIHIQDKKLILDALELYSNSNIIFTDAYLVITSRSHDCGIFSFDRDFDHFGIKRREP